MKTAGPFASFNFLQNSTKIVKSLVTERDKWAKVAWLKHETEKLGKRRAAWSKKKK